MASAPLPPVRRGALLLPALLASALLLAASALAGDAHTGAPSLAQAAPLPSYLQEAGGDGRGFDVYSNGFWHGARKVQVLLGPPRLEQRWSIWAPTCARGEQQVRFERVIDIPGPPSELRVNLGAAFTLGWSNPLKSVELLVNGLRAYRATEDFGHDVTLGTPQRKLFRFGNNRLEILATKRVSPPSVPRCNTGSPSTRLGLLASIQGTFSADLRVGRAIPPVEFHPLATSRQRLNFFITNNGPSGALSGSFDVYFSGVRLSRLLASPEKPFHDCVVHDTPPYSVRCPYENFPPGTESKVSVQLVFEPPPGFDSDEELLTRWEVFASGGVDPSSDNNSSEFRETFCAKGSTNPGCAHQS